jgi:hypothetical protein
MVVIDRGFPGTDDYINYYLLDLRVAKLLRLANNCAAASFNNVKMF